ncbi:MAG: hypothetical protein RLZZ450_282 [Pseudomonadota bacterium]|jgi:uncharacterized protein YcaQ
MLRLRSLRAHAISRTLFAPVSLTQAVQRLGFVQADPIRAPARAQDLILRQRVLDYGAGTLERAYASLDVEEDYLYAYGFLTRPLSALLHPRVLPGRFSALDKKVLALVHDAGTVHPRELDAHLGRRRVINAWGGFSQATKRALEHLHHRGLLRVVRRDNGVRVYQVAPPGEQTLSDDERLSRLALAVANVLAPVSESTLQSITSRLRRWVPKAKPAKAQILGLLAREALLADELDGVRYLWPASDVAHDDVPRVVRLLAPFDPLVWDRARFEQLWGWAYRFEAYTPVHKRVRGYYALPLLWRDQVVGWANASTQTGSLEVDVGFVSARPKERDFNRELAAEIERLRDFLRSEPQALSGLAAD